MVAAGAAGSPDRAAPRARGPGGIAGTPRPRLRREGPSLRFGARAARRTTRGSGSLRSQLASSPSPRGPPLVVLGYYQPPGAIACWWQSVFHTLLSVLIITNAA